MGTTTRGVMIDVEHQILGEDAEELWRFYDNIFDPLNAESPCRQSLHHSEFLALLESPNFVKLVARNSENTILGLTTFAVLEDEMPLMPWINPQFFKKRWPEFWGRIIYVPTICVPLNAQSVGTGQGIMTSILEYMREHNIHLIGFDHSMGRIPYLPDLIMKVTKGKPIGQFSERGELDHQAYWLLADRNQLPEE